MIDERALVDQIFKAALAGSDGDITARKNAFQIVAITLLADVLRHTDEFSRERLLHGLVLELRDSVDHLSKLLAPASSPYPRCPEVPRGALN
jgi:hypothetical protein